MYNSIIIGAGFAGAVAARELAERGQRKVLIIERRSHIGGNAYDCHDDAGVLVHMYGPHIFHTNDSRVYEYLSRFSEFTDYEHRVEAQLPGKTVPVPFNLTSIERVYGDRAPALIEKLLSKYAPESKIPIYELTQQDDPELSELADFVFNNVFKCYTEKQWGTPIAEVSKETLSRVPVFLSRDDRYFQDKYQGMPKVSYTKLFENMLDHPNITVRTSAEASELIKLEDGKIYFEGELFEGEVIYTGAADELFDCKYGKLPYRTLDFAFETLPQDSFQSRGTINYTVSEKFTRITEFKKLTGQELSDVTTIMKEYPRAYEGGNDIPYYAILNPENLELYGKYRALADNYKNLYLLGRLAEYRYYNMDAIVGQALALCDKLV